MQIVRRGRAEAGSQKRGETFTSTVWADQALSNEDVVVNDIFFEPGARTYWHSHGNGQLLMVRGGKGYVQTRSGEGAVLGAADVVWAPAGEVHWHGAAPGHSLTHLAVSLGRTAWEEEVSDADYRSAWENEG